MTERLTEAWYDDMGQFDRYAPKSPNIEINCGGDDFQDIIDKLAEYETAEEEGRLVVLPCRAGDTVYEIRSDYTKCSICGDKFNEYECQGCEEECDSRKIYKIEEYTMYILEDIVRHIRCNNWGKTIFTTREEAEKALEEMKKNDAIN